MFILSTSLNTSSGAGASIPPNGNDANFPFPSLRPYFPFPRLPLSLSLPFPFPLLHGGLGAEPQWRGPGGVTRKKMEIGIGFGAFWRIFCFKTAAIQCFTFLWTKTEWILPLSGCNSLPHSAQFGRRLRPLPPVDSRDQGRF